MEQPRAMPAGRRSALPMAMLVLLALAAAVATIGTGSAFSSLPGQAAPSGFAPAASGEAAPVQRASPVGVAPAGLAPMPETAELGLEEMNRPHEYMRDKDRGDVRGESAYQHPPPVPTRKMGELDGTYKGFCDRQYGTCFNVCRRFPDVPQKKRDCIYDCYRQRRACYFKARPKAERFRRI
mmetsp:Transcript_43252/g.128134  ORF Transcript_43252/g.128134 Transcript_43252/m.128134 type:complete len:181 (+) Transcript_43252:49-591(+)